MSSRNFSSREAMIISDFQQSPVTTREPPPRVTVLLRQKKLELGQ